jgi:hypothetical protein
MSLSLVQIYQSKYTNLTHGMLYSLSIRGNSNYQSAECFQPLYATLNHHLQHRVEHCPVLLKLQNLPLMRCETLTHSKGKATS